MLHSKIAIRHDLSHATYILKPSNLQCCNFLKILYYIVNGLDINLKIISFRFKNEHLEAKLFK